MSNLWILNHYAQPPGQVGGTRHHGLARQLGRLGWHVSIIAASVNSSEGRQRLAVGEQFRRVKLSDVDFLWIRTPIYRGNGLGRIINMLTYFARVLMRKNTENLPLPDVILGSSVHPLAAVSAAFLARRYGVPFIFEVRDLWPQTLIDLGKLHPRNPFAIGLRILEKWLYKRADLIITLLPKACDYIVPMGIPSDKIAWIPNGVEIDSYPVPSPAQDSKNFTLMYFGAHGQANGLDCLLYAMQRLSKDSSMSHVRLRLIGEGPMKNSLIKLAANLKLDNVEFADAVPKSEIPSLAASADAFVITVLDLPGLYRYGISMNKIFDYLAASRPIIMASNAANNPIEEAKAGITVSPGDPEALARGITRLVKLPFKQRISMGKSGRDFVEKKHDYRVLALKLSGLLDGILHIDRRHRKPEY